MLSAQKVINLHQADSSSALLLSLKRRIEQLENKSLYDPNQTYLIVPTEEGSLFLEQSQIIHCKASSNYCEIQLRDKKICISRTLKWVAERLSTEHFIRVHSSHLINISAIVRYKKCSNPILELKNGKTVPVSRSHKETVENFFNL